MIHVKSVKILDNEDIEIFLSNDERYLYNNSKLKSWHKLPSNY